MQPEPKIWPHGPSTQSLWLSIEPIGFWHTAGLSSASLPQLCQRTIGPFWGPMFAGRPPRQFCFLIQTERRSAANDMSASESIYNLIPQPVPPVPPVIRYVSKHGGPQTHNPCMNRWRGGLVVVWGRLKKEK